MTAHEPFEAFVVAHQHHVFAAALRLLGDASEAEDIAQSVFLKAYERFEDLQGPEAAGWLRTVTTNLCLNHLSRHRARWVLWSSLGRADGDPVDDWPDPRQQPIDADLMARESQAALQTALMALPDHQRVPLVLVHFHDMRYDEVARHLRVPLTKVRSDIFRGRQALRRALAPSTLTGRQP